MADAADEILQIVRRAADGKRFDAMFVGCAGAGSPAVAAELCALMQSAFPHAAVAVGDDATIALRGAIPHGPGAALVAGTGSIAIAIGSGGATHRVGGLGYLLGDEGSAAWIGVEGLRRLGRVYDGRERDEETSRLVARHLGVSDRAGLIRAVYAEKLDIPRIAALAPSIVAFAGKGNRVSRAIVDRAAKALSELLAAALRSAGLRESAPSVVLCGGLLRDDNYLRALLEAEIESGFPGANIIRAGDPVAGAVRCALELLR